MSSPMIIPGPWSFLSGVGEGLKNWGQVKAANRQAQIEDEERKRQQNLMAVQLYNLMGEQGQIAPGTPPPPGAVEGFKSFGLPAPTGPSAKGVAEYMKGQNIQDIFAKFQAATTPEDQQHYATQLALALGQPTPGAVAQDKAVASTAVPQAQATLRSTEAQTEQTIVNTGRARSEAAIAASLADEVKNLSPEQRLEYFKIPTKFDLSVKGDKDRVRVLLGYIDKAKGDVNQAQALADAELSPDVKAGMELRHYQEARVAWEQIRFDNLMKQRQVAAMGRSQMMDVLVPYANQLRQQLAQLRADRESLRVKGLGAPLMPEAIARTQILDQEIEDLTNELKEANDKMGLRIGQTGIISRGAGDGTTQPPPPASPPSGKPAASPRGAEWDAMEQTIQMLLQKHTTEADIAKAVTAGVMTQSQADKVLAEYRKRAGLPAIRKDSGLIQGIEALAGRR